MAEVLKSDPEENDGLSSKKPEADGSDATLMGKKKGFKNTLKMLEWAGKKAYPIMKKRNAVLATYKFEELEYDS